MPWDAAKYVAYADRFGWTPTQVDDLPLVLEPWILPIHDVVQQVQSKNAEKPSGPGSPGSINLQSALPPPDDD